MSVRSKVKKIMISVLTKFQVKESLMPRGSLLKKGMWRKMISPGMIKFRTSFSFRIERSFFDSVDSEDTSCLLVMK